ncbi:MAG: histidine phosphatase family protein [Acidobacteriota bacterium]
MKNVSVFTVLNILICAYVAVTLAVMASTEPAYVGKVATIDTVDRAALLESLRRGGHVIYLRHAQTEKDYADQVTADPSDGSTQRVLSEAGWHQAKAIGTAFRTLGIPVGKVVSSEYFRAWQTADLAFGTYEKAAALNFEPAEDYSPIQVKAMRTRVKPFLVEMPEAGTNTVLVGHDDPFEAVTGIYPEPQGVAYVLTPDGEGGYAIAAKLESQDWSKLAR